MPKKKRKRITLNVGDSLVVIINHRAVKITAGERENGTIKETVFTVENMEDSCELETVPDTSTSGLKAIFYI